MNAAPSPSWRMLRQLACAAVSLAALWLILRRIDLPQLADVLSHVKIPWLLSAVSVFGLACVLAALRWHLILQLSDCTVHAGATFRTVLIGHFFNTILFGLAGGDIAKTALYSHRYGYPPSAILGTCVLDRSLGGAGLFLLLACAPGFADYSGDISKSIQRFVASPRVWISVGAAIVLSVLAIIIRRRLKRPSPFKKIATTFLSATARLFANPRLTLRGVVLGFLSQACISAMFLLCLMAVTQTPLSLRGLLWTFPVISLVSSAPITFAGAGLREGSALVLLGLYGVPAADAVAASLLVLIAYLIWACIGGVLLWRSGKNVTPSAQNAPVRTFSAVIPTLNEAVALSETVKRAQRVPEVSEIIVVDGGSDDGTRQIAKQLGCRVLEASRGRGGQLRAGAARASGDVVVLLHADTWLPPQAGAAMTRALRDPTVVGGGFWKVFRERNVLMIGSRFRCAVRLFLFGRVMGDQAMFVRRDVLEKIGGVPDMPLMEEFELCRRLRRKGTLALAGATVTTSARRFAKRGVIRAYLRMWRVTTQYYLGASAQKLQRLYEKD